MTPNRNTTLLPLAVGFGATGIGVALPGTLLPTLISQWHLDDQQSGRLFALAWIASAAAALLVRGSLRRGLLYGSVAIAVGATSLAFCNGADVDLWIMVYGLGLGLTMTSVSLIREQLASRPATELLRLNLWWSIGACVCPFVTLHAQRTGRVAPTLCVFALLFVLLAVWASLQGDLKVRRLAFHGGSASYIFKTVPLGLILMTMLSTGLEASAGAWLATYAKRSGAGVAGIVGMPAFFWFGLLMSRWFWSSGRQTISHDKILRGSVGIVAAAWVAIVTLQLHLVAMAIASLCLGFGIGPTYPVLLAWALRFRCGGSIFFLAGVGSAALPWLMGLISGRHHSLRVGLMVPILGSAWMVGSSIVLPLSRWDKANVTLVSVS